MSYEERPAAAGWSTIIIDDEAIEERILQCLASTALSYCLPSPGYNVEDAKMTAPAPAKLKLRDDKLTTEDCAVKEERKEKLIDFRWTKKKKRCFRKEKIENDARRAGEEVVVRSKLDDKNSICPTSIHGSLQGKDEPPTNEVKFPLAGLKGSEESVAANPRQEPSPYERVDAAKDDPWTGCTLAAHLYQFPLEEVAEKQDKDMQANLCNKPSTSAVSPAAPGLAFNSVDVWSSSSCFEDAKHRVSEVPAALAAGNTQMKSVGQQIIAENLNNDRYKRKRELKSSDTGDRNRRNKGLGANEKEDKIDPTKKGSGGEFRPATTWAFAAESYPQQQEEQEKRAVRASLGMKHPSPEGREKVMSNEELGKHQTESDGKVHGKAIRERRTLPYRSLSFNAYSSNCQALSFQDQNTDDKRSEGMPLAGLDPLAGTPISDRLRYPVTLALPDGRYQDKGNRDTNLRWKERSTSITRVQGGLMSLRGLSTEDVLTHPQSREESAFGAKQQDQNEIVKLTEERKSSFAGTQHKRVRTYTMKNSSVLAKPENPPPSACSNFMSRSSPAKTGDDDEQVTLGELLLSLSTPIVPIPEKKPLPKIFQTCHLSTNLQKDEGLKRRATRANLEGPKVRQSQKLTTPNTSGRSTPIFGKQNLSFSLLQPPSTLCETQDLTLDKNQKLLVATQSCVRDEAATTSLLAGRSNILSTIREAPPLKESSAQRRGLADPSRPETTDTLTCRTSYLVPWTTGSTKEKRVSISMDRSSVGKPNERSSFLPKPITMQALPKQGTVEKGKTAQGSPQRPQLRSPLVLTHGGAKECTASITAQDAIPGDIESEKLGGGRRGKKLHNFIDLCNVTSETPAATAETSVRPSRTTGAHDSSSPASKTSTSFVKGANSATPKHLKLKATEDPSPGEDLPANPFTLVEQVKPQHQEKHMRAPSYRAELRTLFAKHNRALLRHADEILKSYRSKEGLVLYCFRSKYQELPADDPDRLPFPLPRAKCLKAAKSTTQTA